MKTALRQQPGDSPPPIFGQVVETVSLASPFFTNREQPEGKQTRKKPSRKRPQGIIHDLSRDSPLFLSREGRKSARVKKHDYNSLFSHPTKEQSMGKYLNIARKFEAERQVEQPETAAVQSRPFSAWPCPHCGRPAEIEDVCLSLDGTRRLTLWHCEPCQTHAVTPATIRQPPV